MDEQQFNEACKQYKIRLKILVKVAYDSLQLITFFKNSWYIDWQ